MPTYVSLIDVTDREVQNTQELASIWGEIRTEFEQHEAELVDSYAILGQHDFLVIFDADDHESAFKSALTLRRHGLAGETMEIVDTDDFSHLVDEI
ncbi:gyd domain protein [Halobiforma lacisalsi AJ5]|uniref:Gyd domain protein n=1 Tax=Natronobacterium lacisalsi AJ5 TaxID=358396 RepID=A0A1P8LW02_NATLA|nr:GYD domain-containing protein [Halobiforma lacisalsi]APW99974.1 gyd domain protein [Halobiforma lacisalsi AJ5]